MWNLQFFFRLSIFSPTITICICFAHFSLSPSINTHTHSHFLFQHIEKLNATIKYHLCITATIYLSVSPEENFWIFHVVLGFLNFEWCNGDTGIDYIRSYVVWLGNSLNMKQIVLYATLMFLHTVGLILVDATISQHFSTHTTATCRTEIDGNEKLYSKWKMCWNLESDLSDLSRN